MTSMISALRPVPISEAPLLVMLLNNRVPTGFPSPAEKFGAQSIDLAHVDITDPQATCFMRGSRHFMREAGIFDKNILAVGHVIKPCNNPIGEQLQPTTLALGLSPRWSINMPKANTQKTAPA